MSWLCSVPPYLFPYWTLIAALRWSRTQPVIPSFQIVEIKASGDVALLMGGYWQAPLKPSAERVSPSRAQGAPDTNGRDLEVKGATGQLAVGSDMEEGPKALTVRR